MANVEWKGMKAIEKMCEMLPERIAKARLGEAYKYALEPTKQAMQAGVPQRTGGLYWSIDSTVHGKQMTDMYGIVGPRRKKNTWNMRGRHAYIIEEGTKTHTITAKRVKAMPIFRFKQLIGWAKEITVQGIEGKKPFSKAIDRTERMVATRVIQKFREIMSREIDIIKRENGDL